MSSTPSEPKRRRPFEPWRKVAVGGALLLLANEIMRAVLNEDMPDLVYLIANIAGYIVLAISFGMFFRDRQAKRDQREETKKRP